MSAEKKSLRLTQVFILLCFRKMRTMGSVSDPRNLDKGLLLLGNNRKSLEEGSGINRNSRDQ